jgi:hypothetical protein
MKQDKKDSRLESLSKLEAQKLQALQNNDTKTASLIQKIIDCLNKKNKK